MQEYWPALMAFFEEHHLAQSRGEDADSDETGSGVANNAIADGVRERTGARAVRGAMQGHRPPGKVTLAARMLACIASPSCRQMSCGCT